MSFNRPLTPTNMLIFLPSKNPKTFNRKSLFICLLVYAIILKILYLPRLRYCLFQYFFVSLFQKSGAKIIKSFYAAILLVKNLCSLNINYTFSYLKVDTMTGEALRKKLLDMGIQQKELADKLGMTRQNFSQALGAKDIKSGLLENICSVLGITMADMYGLTITLDDSVQNNKTDDVRMSRESFDRLMSTLDRQSRLIDELREKASSAHEGNAGCAVAL